MSASAIDMRNTIKKMLLGIERYNPENLPFLERYVDVQCEEKTCDIESNLALLKLYQFQQKYNVDVVAKILLKALTTLPSNDFIACKCLLNDKLVNDDPIIYEIIAWSNCLEMCEFGEFWKKMAENPELHAPVNGFADFVRKFVCHTVGITYQHIHKVELAELLGEVDDSVLKSWIKRQGWKEVGNATIFIACQGETIQPRNITEQIPLEAVAPILRIS